MRVIVTRPAAQAAQWVSRLVERGIDALALPLIDIGAPSDIAAVEDAWRELSAKRLVVFVSPNAVEQFFAHRPASVAWPAQLSVASTGPGTTQALQQLRVNPTAIIEPAPDAPQFDSEALWTRLQMQDWTGAAVLIVRGDGGRDWLADTLRRHGARVDFVAAYRRTPARFDGDAMRCSSDALQRPEEHLWLFSSSEAIDHLVRACPGRDWTRSQAIATHPRIAERARDCGFGVVREARPGFEAVVACIQSIAS
jgi:uroporphyrinogen-III synthase